MTTNTLPYLTSFSSDIFECSWNYAASAEESKPLVKSRTSLLVVLTAPVMAASCSCGSSAKVAARSLDSLTLWSLTSRWSSSCIPLSTERRYVGRKNCRTKMCDTLAITATERISFAACELLSDSGKSLLQRPSRSNLERKVSICSQISHTVICNMLG
jgi:hypothetical protein